MVAEEPVPYPAEFDHGKGESVLPPLPCSRDRAFAALAARVDRHYGRTIEVRDEIYRMQKREEELKADFEKKLSIAEQFHYGLANFAIEMCNEVRMLKERVVVAELRAQSAEVLATAAHNRTGIADTRITAIEALIPDDAWMPIEAESEDEQEEEPEEEPVNEYEGLNVSADHKDV